MNLKTQALALALASLFPALAGAETLPPSALKALLASQDAVNLLHFDEAEDMARQVALEFPSHPLPHIFVQGALLASIQENLSAKIEDRALIQRFNDESETAVTVAEAWAKASPGPEAQVYLGSALGARGLVKLYQGSVLDAYHDGQKASAELRAAVKEDPLLYEAYLGLGQYEYYCGRMSGLLRWVANLQGDSAEGIALLKTGAAHGVYVAIPSRSALARILSQEETDFSAALPYVIELRKRYPTNYYYAQDALAVGRGLGWQDPRSQLLAASVGAQWDHGWRPPAYAKLDLPEAREELAPFLPVALHDKMH